VPATRAATGVLNYRATMKPILGLCLLLTTRIRTADILSEGGELNWPQFVGLLGLFDDSPSLEWGEHCFCYEV
jgi:hypothetical protein